MTHLQGIKEFGALPDSLRQQLEILEQKHQESLNSRALTHAHLNRLNKCRHQTNALMDKVKSLDSEWHSFLTESTSRLHQHAAMYQQRRKELLQQYKTKAEELESIREEVTMASQSLIAQVPAPEMVKQEVDTEGDVEAFLQAAQDLSQTEDFPIEVSDAELLSDDAMKDKKTVPAAKVTSAPKPFKGGTTSPTKVSQNHLKEKTNRHTQANRDRVKESLAAKEDPE
eukprot:Skav210905  [mRNA]  locus=scaffold2900:298748:299428:- [translate_table: standard]